MLLGGMATVRFFLKTELVSRAGCRKWRTDPAVRSLGSGPNSLMDARMLMRSYMLISCLVAVSCLGCGQSTGPQAAKGVPGELVVADGTAAPHEMFGLHHGAPTQTDFGSGPDVRLGTISLTAPAAWKRTKPGSSYYVAEFALPQAGKDSADGRLTISMGSGSIETNLEVFEGQFDTTEPAKQVKKEFAGYQVTLIDVAGGYTGSQHGQSAPADKLPGYRMIVAVIPVDGQLYFIKAVGPQQTIAAHVDGIHAFLGSVQKRTPDAVTAEATVDSGNRVHLKPIALTAPATWKRSKPQSSLVHAEFALPHADKDTVDGRLTVSVVGGTVKDNVDRWKGQFVGKIDDPKIEELEIDGLKATLVDCSGTFGEQKGMSGPVVNRPNYRMVGVLIPLGDQLYVIKAVGPRETISANVDAINSFVGSLKRDG